MRATWAAGSAGLLLLVAVANVGSGRARAETATTALLPAPARAAGPHSADAAGWTPVRAPNPGGDSMLTGISCPTASVCEAVGARGGRVESPLTERWSRGRWTADGAASVRGSAETYLTAVSCRSEGGCVAVGSQSPPGAVRMPLIEQRLDGRWEVVDAPPTGLESSGFDAVACWSNRGCLAVGAGGTAHSGYLVSERWDGRTWSAPSFASGFGAAASFPGLACTSASSCVAVGTTTAAVAFERWDGRTWHAMAGPRTAGDLDGVSCTRPSSCTAVGTALVGGDSLPLIMRWVGTSWTTVSSARPPTRSTELSLEAISCSTAAGCEAVGSYRIPGSTWSRLWAEGSGPKGGWVSQPVRSPRHADELGAVSCAGRCTAVGWSQATSSPSSDDRPVVERD